MTNEPTKQFGHLSRQGKTTPILGRETALFESRLRRGEFAV